MIDPIRAYRELMAALQLALPELHDQIADEVARGKEIRGNRIEGQDRAGRDRNLSASKLGRIVDADVSVAPYEDYERLDLLIASLRTAAETLDTSVAALSDLLTEFEVSSRVVLFRRPESDEVTQLEVALAREHSEESLIVNRLGDLRGAIAEDRDREY